ncbi:immunoglobulin-like domain-containing protein [Corynebacterium halotolerans]|uniref:LamG-like jellyroll fold domain-containing protein n=1 Tax=Corynebacterium halotolerans YIM 70093 = DSM 44683 TaxID=1121362 RepID=M1NXE3_9CORY|nr:immunoglobulin-like domain-containing protein [Corynebacterium halotolerans]AGF72165.1 hypothetical protein A605_05795 [Corynebacterium halotolerans YIM 70093 = DSM 44683]
MTSKVTRSATALAVAGALGTAQLANVGMAHAQEAPAADILDVRFDGGNTADTAQNIPAEIAGDPVLEEDGAIDSGVARFDGFDDALMYEIGDDYAQLADGLAVECVFRYDGTFDGSEKSLCANKEAGGFAMVVYGDDLTFTTHVGGGYKQARTQIEEGRWYHAVGVWDGEQTQLYVNGELVDTTAAAGEMQRPGSNSTALTLGADSGSNNSPQFMAEATVKSTKIFSEPINAAEAAALYEQSDRESEQRLEIASTTPAAGARLTEAAEFQVEFVDPALLSPQVRYTLDGEEIAPGDLIGPGLTEGEHVIALEAVDVFGNDFTEEITFTSGDIPVDGGTDTAQGEGTVSLSAIAENPSGGDVVTTFTEGATSTAQEGFQGVLDGLPTTLDFEHSEGAEITDQVKPGDGNSVESVSTGRLPFQRFDVAMPENAENGHQLVWNGAVDPTRTARLFAWNTAQGTWDELGSTNGVADGQVSIAAEVGGEYVDGDVVHAMVVGYDPFADNLDEPVRDGFADPDEYDFAISHHTDTQYISEGAVEQETEEERAVWRQAYEDATQWVAENADERKIAYHAHTGDIIENWHQDDDWEHEDRAREEFEVADQAQEILDEAGVVNGVLPGNHDNVTGQDNGADNLYNEYFGPERYEDLEETAAWQEQNASHHPWKPGDNDNHYDLFSAAGLDFVAVSLGYDVTEEEAAWADGVLKQYSDRNAIVLTHAYNDPSNSPDGRGAGPSHDGVLVLQEVVEKNPNVALVLSGHEHGVSIVTRNDAGTEGNHVVELLADYQFYEVSADELGLTEVGGYNPDDGLQFGASFLRLLQFDLDAGEMIVDTYSPFLDNFGASEYDTRGRYNGTEDDTRLPIQFETRRTSFSTDGLTLVGDTGETIGEAQAASGWPATVEWDGLESGEVYAWYATSRDAVTGEDVTPGSTRQFAVFTARDAGTDTTAPELSVPSEDLVVRAGEQVDLLDGVTATDDVDGDVSSSIEVIGNVDTTTPGRYAITYAVSDANGNQAVANRVVVVEAGEQDDSGSSEDSSGSAAGSSGSSGSSNGLLGIFDAFGGALRGIFDAIAGLFRL